MAETPHAYLEVANVRRKVLEGVQQAGADYRSSARARCVRGQFSQPSQDESGPAPRIRSELQGRVPAMLHADSFLLKGSDFVSTWSGNKSQALDITVSMKTRSQECTILPEECVHPLTFKHCLKGIGTD